jgi:hypothetical protein
MPRVLYVEMLTAAIRQGPPIWRADDIDGEPPRVQNTPICTGTWPLDLDPQAVQIGEYARPPRWDARTGSHQRYRPLASCRRRLNRPG